MKKTLTIIGITILVLTGVQYLIYTLTNLKKLNHTVKEFRPGGYKMINPVLDFYELEPVRLKDTKDLESKLNDYIRKAEDEKRVQMISVYYRDLNNGPWMAIGEKEYYIPASLLKIPVLIAALKQAEDDSAFLSKKVFYSHQESNNNRNIIDGYNIVPGRSYSINELLEFMIKHSDNDAVNLLFDNIRKNLLDSIFIDLNLENCLKKEIYLTVKDYATFFRILYNATYLDRKMSEKALLLLSQSSFVRGIVAGVPSEITVAHKFGEKFSRNSNTRQLHECGIVYKKDKPYLLCIMTKGTDFDMMAKAIADISEITYNSQATTKQTK